MPPFPSPTKNWHSSTYAAISPSRPELSATGKTVVVTGGGTGIGAAAALAFAEAGAARIVLLGRRKQPLMDTKTSIEKQFPRVEVLVAPADVTKEDEVNAALEQSIGNGKVDVLVSNAGMVGPHENVADVDTDKFMNTINGMVRGAVVVLKAFDKRAAHDAVVIETNSSAAHLNFTPGLSAYSTAKIAVYRLWDSYALGHQHIGVFHAQPGVVDTDMNKEAGGIAATGISDDASLAGTFYVWLASPEAQFLKNKFVWVNWDVEELKADAKDIQKGERLGIQLVGWPFGEGLWKSPWTS